ncbi:YncE family protein [Ralstonia solanacearum]|uniref:YVTN family beta-propeller repeat protein n=1 Tax=Ralstonia solanacearum TaxID=305 RepID=UPI0005ACF33B|nr:YncE family protein [Ralstonia solanacearum]MDC6176982.1 YncE family protein [Ralstonia solanacearum]MDC6211379.1 YncE family protein [Ralstonia solanacearum]MDC6240844.1 YncE family protein [Ralstonia solanacearum]MDD7802665.1 YncE family protein [Ralstonia solanacearum]TYZ55055.1 YncE family protein [Ralstonia solanacearum]
MSASRISSVSRWVSLLALSAAVLAPLAAHAEVVTVLNSGDASVTLIDKDSRKVLETFPIGKEPHHLIVTPDEKSLIVANAVGNELVFLDPLTGKIQQRVPRIDDPYQIGFSPDQKWFLTTGNRLDRVDIYRWDGHALSIAKQLPLAKTPSHIAFTADSKVAFVTLQDSNEVVAIDLPTQTVMWRMTSGAAPAGVWVTTDQKYLLVGMTGADFVEVIDWRNRTSVKRIPTGKGAHNFRALGDKRHLFLSNRVSGTISIIDEQTLTKVGDITGLPPGPDDMELTADGKQLWVTCRWAKRVAIVDVASRKVVEEIKVGRSPHGIYFRTRAPLI